MEWLKKVLTDEKDNPSSKRLIAMVGSLIMFLTLIFNSSTDVARSPSPDLIAGIVTIICVCLGASTVDKFSVK
jgi:hypothetical protein